MLFPHITKKKQYFLIPAYFFFNFLSMFYFSSVVSFIFTLPKACQQQNLMHKYMDKTFFQLISDIKQSVRWILKLKKSPSSSTRSMSDSRPLSATVPMSRSSLQEWSPPAQWRPPVAPPCPPSIMPHPRRPRRPNQTGPTPTSRPRSRSLTTPTPWTTGTAAAAAPRLFTFTSHLHHLAQNWL